MKKTAVFLSLLFLTSCAHAENSGSGFAGRDEARYVRLNTSSFDNNLSPDDVDVQTAMETIDEIVGGGGGGGLAANDIDTSAELRTILTDENGTGALLFSGATSPTFVTPVLGVAAATSLNPGGVVMTGDGDGALTILGAGDGFDEDIILNLDDTGNTLNIYSSTGVDTMLLTGIDLSVPDDAYNATTWNANTDVPTKNAVRDIIETVTATTTFQKSSDVLNPITATDAVTAGSTTRYGKIAAFGTADEAQLVAIGNGTQTEPLISAKNAALAEVFSVENDGTIISTGTGTEAWTWGSGGQATFVTTYNLSGTDFTATASSGTMTYSGNLASDAITVDTEVYDATGWNGDNTAPTKDAVRDKIETISGGAANKNVMCGTTNSTFTATFYMSSASTGSSTEAATVLNRTPIAGVVRNLYFKFQNAPDNGGGTQSWTVVAKENGSATGITCVASEATATCEDTSNSFTLDAGNYMNFAITAAGTPANTGSIGYCYEFEPS